MSGCHLQATLQDCNLLFIAVSNNRQALLQCPSNILDLLQHSQTLLGGGTLLQPTCPAWSNQFKRTDKKKNGKPFLEVEPSFRHRALHHGYTQSTESKKKKGTPFLELTFSVSHPCMVTTLRLQKQKRKGNPS